MKNEGTVEIVTGNHTQNGRSGTIQLMTGVNYDPISGQISFQKLEEKLAEHQKMTQKMIDKLNPPPLKERIKNAVYSVVRFLP